MIIISYNREARNLEKRLVFLFTERMVRCRQCQPTITASGAGAGRSLGIKGEKKVKRFRVLHISDLKQDRFQLTLLVSPNGQS